MAATQYATQLITSTAPFSGDTVRLSVSPNAAPSANDSIGIVLGISEGQIPPVAPSSIVMPTDGSTAFVEVTTDQTFVGNLTVSLGTGGNSVTLHLPINPSSYSMNFTSPPPIGSSGHANYGSVAGMIAIDGLSEVVFMSNPEADSSVVNPTLTAIALNYADVVIDAYFRGVFLIPLSDGTGQTPFLVADWANGIGYRWLLRKKMGMTSVLEKGQKSIDPLADIKCQMRQVKAMQMDLGLIRPALVNSPGMRGGRAFRAIANGEVW